MKNIKFLILFIAIALISCERDDICAETTQTTARLVIEFYDVDNPTELKNVPRLTVYGEGLLNEAPESFSNETLLFNDNKNKVELPLLIGPEGDLITTRFILERDTNLRLDTDTPETSNVDIIEITYNTEFIYVSRACGYKSHFNNIGVVVDPDDSETWISNIETLETTVENEFTTHVRILH